VKVDDGDTICVVNDELSEMVHGKPGCGFKVRLYGVNCPERGQPFSRRAKKFLRSRILKKKVEVDPVPQGCDRFCRVLAVVRFDGKNLNHEVVNAGLGLPPWFRKSVERDDELRRLEAEKRKLKWWIWGR